MVGLPLLGHKPPKARSCSCCLCACWPAPHRAGGPVAEGVGKWGSVRDPSPSRTVCAAWRDGLVCERRLTAHLLPILTVIFASLSCPLLQPPTSGPLTSSFGGAGFSEDPFKSKQDTPALPPKKPAPPRPKPPSGQYTFFSCSPPTPAAEWWGTKGPCVHQPRGQQVLQGPCSEQGGLSCTLWPGSTHCVWPEHFPTTRPHSILPAPLPGSVRATGGFQKPWGSCPLGSEVPPAAPTPT